MPTLVRHWRSLAMLAAFACVLVFALFEVRLRPEFSWPREVAKPDPTQEARYRQCVDERTDEATREAIETADNPDVQSLMIRMQQKEAIDRCRREFPERTVTISEPLRVNVIDFSWRFAER